MTFLLSALLTGVFLAIVTSLFSAIRAIQRKKVWEV
jgi:hypothetical protein